VIRPALNSASTPPRASSFVAEPDRTNSTGRSAGLKATGAVKDEWPAFGIIEVDQPLLEHAAGLAVSRDLRSRDSLHLAAALLLPRDDLVFATWDRRLREAAFGEGFRLLPENLHP
jgi:uncharacterized protein